MKKQVIGIYNPWNFDLEHGDRVIDSQGNVFDLYESKGSCKVAAGELSYRLVSSKRKKAVKINNIWYWKYN